MSDKYVPESEKSAKNRGQAAVAQAWEAEAKSILKAELARRDVSYKALVKQLAMLGISDDEKAIANRISRGKFQFAFFLQCMRAIGVVEVDLRDRSR